LKVNNKIEKIDTGCKIIENGLDITKPSKDDKEMINDFIRNEISIYDYVKYIVSTKVTTILKWFTSFFKNTSQDQTCFFSKY